jgi:hypothetical protein
MDYKFPVTQPSTLNGRIRPCAASSFALKSASTPGAAQAWAVLSNKSQTIARSIVAPSVTVERIPVSVTKSFSGEPDGDVINLPSASSTRLASRNSAGRAHCPANDLRRINGKSIARLDDAAVRLNVIAAIIRPKFARLDGLRRTNAFATRQRNAAENIPSLLMFIISPLRVPVSNQPDPARPISLHSCS